MEDLEKIDKGIQERLTTLKPITKNNGLISLRPNRLKLEIKDFNLFYGFQDPDKQLKLGSLVLKSAGIA